MNLRRFFTWLFTPLARRLAGVSPNTLTGISILAGPSPARCSSWRDGRPAYFAAATAFVVISGATDALDGLVARLSGRVSKLGELFDHVGDRLIDIFILGGIAAMPDAHPMLGIGVIILALLHAYLGTQIEATFGIRDYSGAGKAELFVGFIAFGAVLTVASLPAGASPYAAWLPNIFLSVLGASAVVAFAFRLRQAYRLGRNADADRSSRVRRTSGPGRTRGRRALGLPVLAAAAGHRDSAQPPGAETRSSRIPAAARALVSSSCWRF